MKLIMAISEDNAINIVWPKLKQDLRFFKFMTIGEPVVMGRKTWDSLPGKLPGRANIVLSRGSCFDGPDRVYKISYPLWEFWPHAWIIGGTELTNELIAHGWIDLAYITRVPYTVGNIEGRVEAPDLSSFESVAKFDIGGGLIVEKMVK